MMKSAKARFALVCAHESYALIAWLHSRIDYLRPSTDSLIYGAWQSGQFNSLTFLPQCVQLMDSGKSFPHRPLTVRTAAKT
jgi:hypothetical protein